MTFLRGINVRAIAVGVGLFYLVPLLPLLVLASVPVYFAEEDGTIRGWGAILVSVVPLWFLAVAPTGSGYFTAKLARVQPLKHGLIAGGLGFVIVAAWLRLEQFLFYLPLLAVVLSCGILGAWIWRYRSTGAEL